MKRVVAAATVIAATLILTTPAWAPFHLVVIEQVFFGTDTLPEAQYVMLRTLQPGQIFVSGQPFNTQNADGSNAGTFATFSRSFFAQAQAPDSAMLAGTQAAEDLFCLPMDELASGSLVFPDGRVCFGVFNYNDGRGDRPVDCVAYGTYMGSNEPYLPAAMAPEHGLALVRAAETDNNQNDFVLLPPMPQSVTREVGQIDGVPGDTDGDGGVHPADIEDLAHLLFTAARRCDLEVVRRGADANVDTRLGAADLLAATLHLSPPLG